MYTFLILFTESIILPLKFENTFLRHACAVFSFINAMEKVMTSREWAPMAIFDGAQQKVNEYGLQNCLTKFDTFVKSVPIISLSYLANMESVLDVSWPGIETTGYHFAKPGCILTIAFFMYSQQSIFLKTSSFHLKFTQRILNECIWHMKFMK